MGGLLPWAFIPSGLPLGNYPWYVELELTNPGCGEGLGEICS